MRGVFQGVPAAGQPHKPLIAFIAVLSGLAVTLTLVVRPLLGQAELPRGQGADLVSSKCLGCHSRETLMNSAGISRPMWRQVMREMEALGLEVTREERETITDYLAAFLGPDTPPAAKAAVGRSPAERLNGAQLYNRECSGCHQKDGRGLSGRFPPLAGNPYLFQERLYNVLVLLYGLEGGIEVQGRTFTGAMPSFSHLSDQDIVTLADQTLRAWGNDDLLPAEFEPLDKRLVKRARRKGLTARQVREYRPSLQ